jgi:hypothetical protein
VSYDTAGRENHGLCKRNINGYLLLNMIFVFLIKHLFFSSTHNDNDNDNAF